MKIVIVKEKSDGNETVGSMWVETFICDENTTIKEILEWEKKECNESRNGKYGRLMITVADDDEPKEDVPF